MRSEQDVKDYPARNARLLAALLMYAFTPATRPSRWLGSCGLHTGTTPLTTCSSSAPHRFMMFTGFRLAPKSSNGSGEIMFLTRSLSMRRHVRLRNRRAPAPRHEA